jgi:hypothetical protein
VSFCQVATGPAKAWDSDRSVVDTWSPGSDASEDEKEKVSKKDLGDFK